MIFSYCFNPCVARLAIGWNELEPNKLLFFLVMNFLAIVKREWSFIR